jgi:acetolactate synthase-1/2/3 large subunit
MNGGQIIIDWMRERGLTHFFHVPGESFLPVLDALRDEPGITIVTARHESGASFSAEGFAKVAGRPAVCMATRGPGASNLSIGVQTAFYDSTPMIALLGLIPTPMNGSRAFQEFDPTSMYASISKQVLVVNRVESLAEVLDQALVSATSGRPGPVVIGLPADILGGQAPAPQWPRQEAILPPPTWDPSGVIEVIKAAKRPAILSATEAVRGEAADRIGAFAEATGLPVFGAWRRFSAFSAEHPNFVGALGLGAQAYVADALSESDLVLSFGFGLEQVTFQSGKLTSGKGLSVIQFAPAVDAPAGRHAGSAKITQVALAPEVAAKALADWAVRNQSDAADLAGRHGARTRELHGRVASAPVPAAKDGELDLDRAFQVLNGSLGPDDVVTSDAGNFAQWLLRYVRLTQRKVFVAPVNGAMGYGLPSAVGAALAHGKGTVWCIAGDGGFLMTAGEMETASRLGLDIVAIVTNNSRYGTIRARQEGEFPGRQSGTDLGAVDFAAAARALGWQGWRATTDAEVDQAIASARAASGCRLVELVAPSSALSLD